MKISNRKRLHICKQCLHNLSNEIKKKKKTTKNYVKNNLYGTNYTAPYAHFDD